MSKKILLVGGGGHCKSVLDSLLELNQFKDIGIIDVKENIGKNILGISVIGCDDNLEKLFNDGYQYAFVTVGSIGNPNLRIKLFDMIEKIGFQIPNIIDPSAIVSAKARLEEGIFVGKRAVINAGSILHKGAIINTGAIIEHDCKISNFVHVAPGVVLSGEVSIGKNSHIGSNSVIKQQVNIGENTIIGMGSVVLKDIEYNVMAYGNPCKEVRIR
ncbi:acetyltransferase [Anaerophilus nitritogenes]|uniref:acetyltransferase n=1 Tax=Anaerophilus nitritogenes TaxID=2498136 RepID=UPI00101C776F|nr:acetyltransferase [Anaerophilus nitritogenes]